MVGKACLYPPPAFSAVIPDSVPLRLHTELLTAADLGSQQDLAHDLVDLVNAGFYRPQYWSSNRFQSYDGLCETLGPDGLCAVIFEELEEHLLSSKDETGNTGTECVVGSNLGNGTKRVVVASASARPKATDNELGNNFEFFAVVSCNSPRYRRKGLAEQCLRLLEGELLNCMTEPAQRQQGIHIWLYVAEEINGKYWRNKGYEVVQSGPAPDGLWGAKMAFTLIIMLKSIKVPNTGSPEKEPSVQAIAI